MEQPSSDPSPVEKSKQLVKSSRELLAELAAVLEKQAAPQADAKPADGQEAAKPAE